ncbi:putative lipoprotein, partial [Yersinia pestis PY-88]
MSRKILATELSALT